MKTNFQAFEKVLDPEDNTTGGGSASAITGAMAGALVAMVCRLSAAKLDLGKEIPFDQIALEAQELSVQLMSGSQQDSQAFQAVSAAYKLPKQTEEQQTLRQEAIQTAWREAAQVPLDNAGHCLRVFKLGTGLLGSINPKVASDLSCALFLSRAGLLGCLENVAINLPAVKDQAAAAALAGQADRLRQQLSTTDDPPANSGPTHNLPPSDM